MIELLENKELEGPFFEFFLGDVRLVEVRKYDDLYLRLLAWLTTNEKNKWREVVDWSTRNLEGKLYVSFWTGNYSRDLDYKKNPKLLFTSEKDKLLFSLAWLG